MEKIEPIELQEFVRQAIREIEAGIEIGKRSLDGTINFDVSVTRTQKIAGNVKVYVLGSEGENQKENLARISFKVRPSYPSKPQSILYKEPKKNMGHSFRSPDNI